MQIINVTMNIDGKDVTIPTIQFDNETMKQIVEQNIKKDLNIEINHQIDND